MPIIVTSLFIAGSAQLFAVLAGHAIEKRDYRVAGLWAITSLGLLVNGALLVHRHFLETGG